MAYDYFEAACAVVDRPTKLSSDKVKFWRDEPPLFSDDGKMVKGGMFEHQLKWWNLPNFYKVLVAGYGAGKTLIGCKRIIALALTNAPCLVATVSPSFPVARKTVIETLIHLLAGKQTLYGREFWWKYNKTLHEFYIRYHGRSATIFCLSGDDPLSLRGPNLSGALIDEPFIQDQSVFTQMVARVRHPDAVHSEILLTGTPEQLGWGYDLCVGELKGANDVGLVQASTRQNLALNGDYVKRLEGVLTGKAADAYIDGAFVNLTEGLIYYGFEGLGEKNVRHIDFPEHAELGAGMDFNVNPMSAAVFWRKGNHMHFFDEIELPNADTQFMCDTLTEKYKEYGQLKTRLLDIYPDASGSARKTSAPGGRTDFWYIKEAGYNVRAHHAHPHRKDRYNAVNGKFNPKVGPPTLTVEPTCKKLIKYLSLVSHEEMHKQEAMIHLLDAFSYPVEFLYPVSHDRVMVHKLSGT